MKPSGEGIAFGLMFMACLGGVCAQLPVSESSGVSGPRLNRVRTLMAELHIADTGTDATCLSWSFPKYIMMKGHRLAVVGDAEWGDYSVYSGTDSRQIIGTGRVLRMSNPRLAREAGIGMISMNNLPLQDLASQVSVSVLGTQTNLLYVSHASNMASGTVLIYKNLCVSISAVSNKLAIASTVLNAGLQEKDRIRLPVQ